MKQARILTSRIGTFDKLAMHNMLWCTQESIYQTILDTILIDTKGRSPLKKASSLGMRYSQTEPYKLVRRREGNP